MLICYHKTPKNRKKKAMECKGFFLTQNRVQGFSKSARVTNSQRNLE